MPTIIDVTNGSSSSSPSAGANQQQSDAGSARSEMDQQQRTVVIRPRRALHAEHTWRMDAFSEFARYPKGDMQRVGPSSEPHGVKHPISVIHPEKRHRAKAQEGPSLGSRLMKFTNDYLLSTTLHGLKYVGETSLSAFERLFWLTSFLTGTCFAIYFITSLFNKFDTSPMVISFSPTLVFLNQIPFPAVTICNVNLALNSKVDKIKSGNSTTAKSLLADLCNEAGNHEKADASAGDWKTVEKFVIDINQKCEDMVKVCKWNGTLVQNCGELIKSVLTDEGYCCSFNRLPLNFTLRGEFNDTANYPANILNWNAEEGYGDAPRDVYPYRCEGTGQNLGLSLVLDAQLSEYHCTSTNSVGFKVLLSSPLDSPKIAEVGFFLSPGDEARITIAPDVKDATDGVRGISVEKRQCFFAAERPLKYYIVYTERNCRLECQANYTLRMCGCVPYYLPRNPQTVICDKEKEKCVAEAQDVIDRFTDERRACKCLPSCNDIWYKPDTMSVGKILPTIKSVNQDLLQDHTLEYFADNMIIAHFYFDIDKFTKQTKSEMYGFSEFLSNTGGLLGLFLGFSFLSAVEIFYFIFFRGPCSAFRKYRARKLKERKAKQWSNNMQFIR